MKPLKRTIITPFILIITVFPLITLLLFNFSVNYYLDRNAKTELQAVVRTMENAGAENLTTAFTNLYKALRASKLAINTEMLFYTRNRNLLNLHEDTESFINEQLMNQLSARLPVMQDNRVYTVRVDKEKYFVLSYPVAKTGRPAVVFISHADKETALIRFINLLLLSIMLLGALLAIVLAGRLSKRITRPVSELCSLTEKIGRGQFSVLPQTRTDDIKELHVLRQSIGEMAGRLQAYDKAQKSFLQNASHELKTPLMSIQGYAEGMISGVVPDVKRAAGIIESESKRLGNLVEELLTLSRIESQTYSKELVRIDLENALKEYKQRLEGAAAKQQRKLKLTLPGKPVFVLADDTLLSQAVTNLVSNCLRYAKTAVVIALLTEGNTALIRISDDGEGIPKADLPHIFERFYKGQGGNFGLGLAIAKSAVEFMNGSIRADNDKTGAVFEIRLPLA